MADVVTTTRGANVASTDELNAAIDKVRDLLVEQGYDEGTANALVNAARPAGMTVVGNMADLQRMGSIINQGVIPTPPTEPDEETNNTEDAFKLDEHQQMQIQAAADDQGVRNVVGSGWVTENQGTPGDGGVEPDAGASQPEAAQSTTVNDSMTKDELTAEAQRRGVNVTADMTKAQIIDAINGAPANA